MLGALDTTNVHSSFGDIGFGIVNGRFRNWSNNHSNVDDMNLPLSWTLIPLAPGITNATCICELQVARTNYVVHMRGSVRGQLNQIPTATPLIGTLPLGFRPSQPHEQVIAVEFPNNTSLTSARILRINTNGEIRLGRTMLDSVNPAAPNPAAFITCMHIGVTFLVDI